MSQNVGSDVLAGVADLLPVLRDRAQAVPATREPGRRPAGNDPPHTVPVVHGPSSVCYLLD